VERVDVDGLTIAFERAGRGPAVVLLHGYVGDGRSLWRHQINGLSSAYTVVAWDALGAGASSDPPESLGIDGYAACLARFIEALRLGPVHVVGLSFGGALAIAFQRRHRSLARSLVLASAPRRTRWPEHHPARSRERPSSRRRRRTERDLRQP
jgi:pimeloyl-ACP methyl ester carboxylesterase